MAFNGRKCKKREKGETMNQITNGDQRNSINSKHKKRRKKGLEKMDLVGSKNPPAGVEPSRVHRVFVPNAVGI